MISEISKLGIPNTERALKHLTWALVAEGILTGVAFVLFVPFLQSLIAADFITARSWLIAIIISFVLYAILRFVSQLYGFNFAMSLGDGIFGRLSRHIAALPVGWFTSERVGDVGQITSQGVVDILIVPAFLMRPVINALVTPLTVALIMFAFDWRVALAMLACIPVLAVVYRKSGATAQKTELGVHKARANVASRAVEFSRNQPALRAFGAADTARSNIDRAFSEQANAEREQIRLIGRGIGIFVLTIQAAFTALIFFFVMLVLQGDIGVPEIVALLVLLARYVEPLLGAADLDAAIRMSQNSLARMQHILDTPVLSKPTKPEVPQDHTISFSNVVFGYDAEPVLNGISFTAKSGQTTAIVGASGAGKTTLLRLAARFWEAESGSIEIGGINVSQMDPDDLLSRIAIVFQDVYLFDGTIRDNIRFGRLDASDTEVEAAARAACVDEISERLPNGLDTQVGEGGAILSGGERQRVSIARAILKDAPIILLDEATSALDRINEASIQTALRALTKDRTVLVIAHRLNTIQSADHIVVLQDGKIAEAGQHKSLLSQKGLYAELWNERQKASGWKLVKS